MEEPKYVVPEQKYHREYLAPEPSAPNFDVGIPPLPPSWSEMPRTRQASTSSVVKKMSTITEHHLSSIQQGILQDGVRVGVQLWGSGLGFGVGLGFGFRFGVGFGVGFGLRLGFGFGLGFGLG